MADILSIIITILVLWLWCVGIRTVRDERQQLLKLLVVTAIATLIGQSAHAVFGPKLDPIFSSSMQLCLAFLISLYLRNIQTESKTSRYLFLLALFPFILFVICYLWGKVLAFKGADSLLYEASALLSGPIFLIVFATSIWYDFLVLRQVGRPAVFTASLDGQLARSLGVLKIVFFISLSVRESAWLDDLPAIDFEVPFGMLTFIVISLFLCSSRLRFALVHLRERFPENRRAKQEDPLLTLEDWQRIDRLIDERKLYLHKTFSISDMQLYTVIPLRDLQQLTDTYLPTGWASYLDSKRLKYVLDHLDDDFQDVALLQRLIRLAGFSSNRHFRTVVDRELGFGAAGWEKMTTLG